MKKSLLHAFLVAIVMLAGCATNPALEESRRLQAEGRLDEAVLHLEQALRERPDDRELRATYYRQRELLVGSLLANAESARLTGRAAEAEALFHRVLRIDPGNSRAQLALSQLAARDRHAEMLREADALLKKGDAAGAEARVRAVLSDNPQHAEARQMLRRVQQEQARAEPPASAVKGPFSQPITMEFRDAALRSVFEVISRTAGVNFVFDKDVRADTKVTIFVRNTTIDDVIRLILVTNQLERKLLNENTVLIYPNTPAKNKDYQEMVVRSFYLANTDVKQAQTLVKSMVKTRDVFVDDKLNLLVVRDTPEAVRLVERVLETLDVADPEVMLEVEVMEVSRNKLLELGVRWPDQIGYGLTVPSFTSVPTQTQATDPATGLTTTTNNTTLIPSGSRIAEGVVDLRDRRGLTSFAANPLLLLNLRSQDGDANLLANPRIRVRNREKAKIHIGEKLPVFTTTTTANVGVSASISYLDVGLKLDVEPTVHLEEDVMIRVALEVSSVVREVPGPQSSLAYQVGTRSATTALRLRNGETQILAGLISDEERSSANKLPGLGDLPVLGRLFSSTRDTANKTEIVLLITPRILRSIPRPDAAALTVPSGTDSSIGTTPMQIRPTPPRSIGLSSRPTVPTPGGPVPDVEVTPIPGGAGPLAGGPGAGAPGAPVAPGAGPGAGPGAAAQAPTDGAAPTPPPPAPSVIMAVPSQASLGRELVVAITVAGAGPEALGGQAEVTFDSPPLEQPGVSGGGNATVNLAPGGGGLRGELRLRTGNVAGTAQIRVVGLRLTDRGGAPLAIQAPTLPPVMTVTLVP